MSTLDQAILLCEGGPNSPDLRLLEACRDVIARSPDPVSDLARRVFVRPAGSKMNLAGFASNYKSLFSGVPVIALRDRDFQTAGKLQKDRDEFRVGKVRPIVSLARHAIESYLLDPPFLTQALLENGNPPGSWGDANTVSCTLENMARERLWMDVARATLETVAFLVRRDWHPKVGGAPVIDVSSARVAVEASLEAAMEQTAGRLAVTVIDELFDEHRQDLVASQPLWHRVDGPELFKQVQRFLVDAGYQLGTESLIARLLSFAERKVPPSSLVSELQAVLRDAAVWLAPAASS